MKKWLKGIALAILNICFITAQVVPEEGTSVTRIPALLKVIGLIFIPIAFFIMAIIFLRNKFKNKLWLKWGLIFEFLLLAQIISVVICWASNLSCRGVEWCGIECIFPSWPQFLIGAFFGVNLIPSFILSIIIYFGIGALIGLIIQNVKKK